MVPESAEAPVTGSGHPHRPPMACVSSHEGTNCRASGIQRKDKIAARSAGLAAGVARQSAWTSMKCSAR